MSDLSFDVKILADRKIDIRQRKFAGTQGDVAPCNINFDVSDINAEGKQFRVEWHGCADTYEETIPLQVVDDVVTAPLPSEIIKAGGTATAYLLEEKVVSNEVTQRICSYPVRLYLGNKATGNNSVAVDEYNRDVASMYLAVVNAKDEVENSVNSFNENKGSFEDLVDNVNEQIADVNTELENKQDKLTAGNGINITDDVVSVNTEVIATKDYAKSLVSTTAEQVGADAAGTAQSEVEKHNVNTESHNDIRLELEGVLTKINTLLDSDDLTLDQLSEIVAYIKNNKELIDNITTSKINVKDIINNLITNVSNKPLSAAQGVVLKGLIDGKQDKLTAGNGINITDDNVVSVDSNSNVANAIKGYATGTNLLLTDVSPIAHTIEIRGAEGTVVNVTSNSGNDNNSNLEAGLYDENDNLQMSWDEIVDTYPDVFNESSIVGLVDGDSGISYLAELSGKLVIDGSITSIGINAFKDCYSLTSITIPDSVTSIGFCAFAGCDSLTSITIPDSVTSIGESAFSNCSSLTSITIPDSVISIGDLTFNSCYSLASVTIPDSVTSIGEGAFLWCTSLASVIIPNSVTSIGNSAFAYCTSLTSILYVGTEEQWNSIEIDDDAFIDVSDYTVEYNYIINSETSELIIDASGILKVNSVPYKMSIVANNEVTVKYNRDLQNKIDSIDLSIDNLKDGLNYYIQVDTAYVYPYDYANPEDYYIQINYRTSDGFKYIEAPIGNYFADKDRGKDVSFTLCYAKTESNPEWHFTTDASFSDDPPIESVVECGSIHCKYYEEDNAWHTECFDRYGLYGKADKPDIKGIIPSLLASNTEYYLGDVPTDTTLAFPSSASQGDCIYINFNCSAEFALTIDTTYTSDIDIDLEVGVGYEIFATWNGSMWILGYNEYTVGELDE